MYLHRQRITIYRENQSLVDGAEVTTLEEITTIWGKLRPLKADEARVSGNRPEEFADVRLYCSPYADIQFRDLVRNGEDVFRVLSVTKRKGLSQQIEADLKTDPQAKAEIGKL